MDDQTKWPRVTDILKANGLYPDYPDDPFYRDRGTFVHKAVELWIKDELDEDLLDPQIAPYLEAYKKFQEDKNFAPHKDRLELRLYHPKCRYTGRPDLPGVMDCKEVLIDLKSGAPTKSDPIQGAAYLELLGSNLQRCDKVFDLYLSGEGTYKLVEVKNIRSHLQVFLACLTLFNYKKENGL